MKYWLVRSILGLTFATLLTACSGSSKTTSTPTGPTTPVAPAEVINAPVPVSPTDGATSNGWPTLTVNDSTHTGNNVGPLVYRFDIASDSGFASILVTSTVSEQSNQTSYTPPATTAAPDGSTFFWRAVAIDPINSIGSPPSATLSFKYSNPPSTAQTIANQEGTVLWTGVQPTGTTGHATLGNGWGIGVLTSYDGVSFLSPQIDELRVFDLLDRGMQPQQAIDWMHANGYSTVAAWFPDVAVIGFAHQYMALINGHWDMVLRAGA